MGVVTFEDMRERSPFELAAWLADRSRWPSTEADPSCHVEELAVMAALTSNLRGSLAGTMHRALLDGAPVEEVAEAAGINTAGVLVEWTQWAVEQRELYEHTRHGARPLGISSADYERVRDAIHGQPPD